MSQASSNISPDNTSPPSGLPAALEDFLEQCGKTSQSEMVTSVVLTGRQKEASPAGPLVAAIAKGRKQDPRLLHLISYIPFQIIRVGLASVSQISPVRALMQEITSGFASQLPGFEMVDVDGLWDLGDAAKEPDAALAPVPLGAVEAFKHPTITGESGRSFSLAETMEHTRIMASMRRGQRPVRLAFALSIDPVPTTNEWQMTISALVPTEDAPAYAYDGPGRCFSPPLPMGTTTHWPTDNLTLVYRLQWVVDPTNPNDIAQDLRFPARLVVTPQDRNHPKVVGKVITVTAARLHVLGVRAAHRAREDGPRGTPW